MTTKKEKLMTAKTQAEFTSICKENNWRLDRNNKEEQKLMDFWGTLPPRENWDKTTLDSDPDVCIDYFPIEPLTLIK